MAESKDVVKLQEQSKKYNDLEGSVQRFQKEADRDKDVLGVEMKDLEDRRNDAENRAETAEEKLRLMEQQLAAMNWKPQDFEKRINELETECSSKDRQIRELEIQVDEQKQLRQQDAKTVEEKAAKIKEWVTNKLAQLEQHNHELEIKNDVLTDQVEILRERLQALPAFAAKEILKRSEQETMTEAVGTDTESQASSGKEKVSKSRSKSRSRSKSPSLLTVEKTSSKLKSQGDSKAVKELNETNDDSSRPASELSSSRSFTKFLVSRSNSEVASSRPESDLLSSRPDSQLTDSSRVRKRPSSSIIEALEMEQEFFNYGLNTHLGSPLGHVSPDSLEFESENFDSVTNTDNISETGSEDSMADIDNIDHDPLYQEVDQNHESTYEPKRAFPPQIRIERKVFQEARRMDSFVSSSNASNDSEDIIERGLRPFAFTDKPIVTVEPMSRSVGFDPIGRSSGIGSMDMDKMPISPLNSSPVTLTPGSPRSPITPITPQLPDLVSTPSMQASHYYLTNNSSNNVSAIATLPRRRDLHRPPPVHFDYEDSVISNLDEPLRGTDDSQVVSAEVHSAPATVTRQGQRVKPPPHAAGARTRFNTWGTRAYPNVHRQKQKQRADYQSSVTEPYSANQLFKDVSIPVYAILKGKATQIRSTPFTEESDESSDDEGASTNEENDPRTDAIVPTSPSRSRSRDVRRKQQLNHSSSGAMKRGVSHQSTTSETSCDYANPPDDTTSRSDSDISEPEQKLLKYTEDKNKHDTLDNKAGYLSKLGGKVKTWKKRWFVLRNGELFYYKSQHDVIRKPQGCIKFDDHTKIVRSHGELSFQITNSKRTYYLTADTCSETDRWVRVLQKQLKRQATSFLLDQVETKAVIKGNITKVKNGITRKCWCVLMGRYFLYYKSPANKTPFGQIHLQDARLEEIDIATDSDEETEAAKTTKHVIVIWPPYQGPTYLILPTKQEKDSWLYHLTVAAGGGTGNVGTHFEQLIAKLMESDGDHSSVFWKHPVLLHSKEPINSPLTTLPSEDLQHKAVELFKVVHQFMSSMIESHTLELHVHMAQTILHRCILDPPLQNELFCHLIKQTSRHPIQNRSTVQNLLLCGKHSWIMCHASTTSPSNSVLDLTAESKLNPSQFVIIQGWQLLSLCVSLFMPKQSVMWLLKVHLHRNADPRSDIGKYAIFCQRAMDRTVLKGLRVAKPSRMEVMSILLRHPYHHSQPISIPVHFLNNSYQVVSFDGSTTIQEFILTLGRSLGVQDCSRSGFALFSDDPRGGEVETCLQNHIKVCDVISKWEEAFRDSHSGKLDTSKTIRLLYKNRLYFKSTSRLETEKEKLLLTYQVNEEIISGRFPLNRDLALELASLMAQIEYGDSKISESGGSQQCSQALDRFYPKKYRDLSEEGTRKLQDRLSERWASLRGRSHQDCVRVYLAVARKWQFCGAKLFLTRVRDCASPDGVWLAVQEEGVAVLEYSTMQPINMYDYRSVVTFGGWNEDLMIVVNQLIESAPHHYEHRTDKLLFLLPRHKVLEATVLIASYINARSQRASHEGNGVITVQV